MNLGFIGFGHLGKAVAGRLLECGHSIIAWNRTPSKMEGINIEKAPSPAAVAEKTDIIFLCMFDNIFDLGCCRRFFKQFYDLFIGDTSVTRMIGKQFFYIFV